MRTSSALIAASLVFGCHERPRERELPSLAPVTQTVVNVVGWHQLIHVTLRAPRKYEFVEFPDETSGHLAAARDDAPEINLVTRSVDLATGLERKPRLRDDQCRMTREPEFETNYWKVVNKESRPDGFVQVCQHSENGHFDHTLVMREMSWLGYPFQCQVIFMKRNLPKDAPAYGEIDPPESRIRDAIAVCDSVTLSQPPEHPPAP